MLNAVVAAGMAFNLVCSGTLTSGDETKPYRYVYIIDLAAKKYCEESSCIGPRDIAEVRPDYIRLKPHVDIDTPHKREFYEATINRLSGRESVVWTRAEPMIGVVTLKWEGQCEKAPFSGFPNIPRKF